MHLTFTLTLTLPLTPFFHPAPNPTPNLPGSSAMSDRRDASLHAMKLAVTLVTEEGSNALPSGLEGGSNLKYSLS